MKKYLQGGLSPSSQLGAATNQFRGLASDLRLLSSKTKYVMTPPSSQGSPKVLRDLPSKLNLNESSDIEIIRPPPKPHQSDYLENLARKKQVRRPASVAEKVKHSKQPSTKATSHYQPVSCDQMLSTHDSDSERRTQRSAMKQQVLKKLLVR